MAQFMTSSQPGALSLVALLGMLALIAAVVFARFNGLIESEAAVRYAGGVFSLLMIGAGNLLPKYARTPKTSRLGSWMLVVGGLISLGLWIWAPEDLRTPVASATALAAFAVAILAAALRLKRENGKADSRPGVAIQHATLHILHGLMWAFAIFLADVTLGRQSVLWMTVGFTLSMSLLQGVLSHKPGRIN